jgi:hypothetical protein
MTSAQEQAFYIIDYSTQVQGRVWKVLSRDATRRDPTQGKVIYNWKQFEYNSLMCFLKAYKFRVVQAIKSNNKCKRQELSGQF